MDYTISLTEEQINALKSFGLSNIENSLQNIIDRFIFQYINQKPGMDYVNSKLEQIYMDLDE